MPCREDRFLAPVAIGEEASKENVLSPSVALFHAGLLRRGIVCELECHGVFCYAAEKAMTQAILLVLLILTGSQ